MSRPIIVDVTHPAHVHFFRPAIRRWQAAGVEVVLVARAKDVTLELLELYGLEYQVLSAARKGPAGLARELLEHEGRLFRLLRKAHAAAVLEIAGTFIVHAARLSGTPALVFYDTEDAGLSNAITYPFATRVITPRAYRGDIGRKHVRYNGYHELAYLRPGYFKPDPAVLIEAELEEGEPFAILRFVAWEASHDIGRHGLSADDKRRLVAEVAAHGRVFISSEATLPAELEPYRLPVRSHRLHDLLAFANLYVGEGATVASEAAVLGTPAVYANQARLGYLDEQAERYGLMCIRPEAEDAIRTAVELISDPAAKAEWQRRRDCMLAETEDVTEFICQQVAAYL
ncbi:MAG: DUF354 domain-containing protein [Candidatus Promineifilaceae bacterium]